MKILCGEFTLKEEEILLSDNNSLKDELKILKKMITFIPYDIAHGYFNCIQDDLRMIKEQLIIIKETVMGYV